MWYLDLGGDELFMFSQQIRIISHNPDPQMRFKTNPLLLLFYNKAVYTAILVACGWAGAVISLCKPQNSKIRDQKWM